MNVEVMKMIGCGDISLIIPIFTMMSEYSEVYYYYDK